MAFSRWMQRLFGVASITALAGVASTSACVEAEARFYVQSVQSFVNVCAEDQISCDEDGTQLLRGGINVTNCEAGGCTYAVVMVLKNGMTSSLDSQANHNDVETGRIQVTEYDISIDSLGYSRTGVLWNGSIAPQGLLCGTMVLLDSQTVADIAASGVGVQEFIVTVKFYGRTTGGLDVETPEYYFAVSTVNDGCNGPVICSPDSPTDQEACGQGLDGAPLTCARCPSNPICLTCTE